MTWVRIALVCIVSVMALEGAVVAAVPDEVRALVADIEPGLLRLVGVLQGLVAAVLLAAAFLV